MIDIFIVNLLKNIENNIFIFLNVLFFTKPKEINLAHSRIISFIKLFFCSLEIDVTIEKLFDERRIPFHHNRDRLFISFLLIMYISAFVAVPFLQNLLINLIFLKNHLNFNILLPSLEPLLNIPLLQFLLYLLFEHFLPSLNHHPLFIFLLLFFLLLNFDSYKLLLHLRIDYFVNTL